MQSSLSIRDLARTTGAKTETIRYYERIGVLPAPNRIAANDRTYAGGAFGAPEFHLSQS
jgi:DNA-binding transcriptional MerR regulator